MDPMGMFFVDPNLYHDSVNPFVFFFVRLFRMKRINVLHSFFPWWDFLQQRPLSPTKNGSSYQYVKQTDPRRSV